MANVYDMIDPYKQIVFVSHEYGETEEGKTYIKDMDEYSRLAVVIEMSRDAQEPNGKLPQDKEWIAKCLDKSHLAASNHRYVGKETGPLAMLMQQMGVVCHTQKEAGLPPVYAARTHQSIGI